MTAAILALVLSCGSEDWAAKTLTDGKPLIGTLEGWDVRQLSSLPAKANDHMVATITAYVLAWKLEADEDFHVVISDDGTWKKTMIAELPSPHCAPGSPHLNDMTRARQDFLELFGLPPKGGRLRRLKKPVRVKISGVVYFDHPHGQTGVAPNAIELHPLLSAEAAGGGA